MGNVAAITREKYPKQGQFLNAPVRVCFHYDTTFLVGGVIVRDDAEAPWQTIIRLDDGRFVLAAECQYSIGRVHMAERAPKQPHGTPASNART